MTDLTARPILEAIQIIKSFGLDYIISCINPTCGKDCIERVVKYTVSDTDVKLTTAYFENNIKDNNG